MSLVDAVLPGRIDGLYLVGSLALNDYQPGRSDIDFVALTAGPLSSGELDRLESVHETLLTEIGRPWFDGIYIPADSLTRNPEDAEIAPHSHDGRFQRSRGFEANPVTWLILRDYAIPIRGMLPKIRHDPEVLRAWALDNLNTYWAGLAAHLERAGPTLSEEAVRRAVGWCVPGVVRLAYTLETGDVISKSGACHYALNTYSELWHPIISDALATRAGTLPTGFPSSPAVQDTIALAQFVIEAARVRATPST